MHQGRIKYADNKIGLILYICKSSGVSRVREQASWQSAPEDQLQQRPQAFLSKGCGDNEDLWENELMEKGGTCCISVLSSREKKSKGEFERLEEPSPLEGSLRLP